MERRKRNMSLKPKAVATGILLSKKNKELWKGHPEYIHPIEIPTHKTNTFLSVPKNMAICEWHANDVQTWGHTICRFLL